MNLSRRWRRVFSLAIIAVMIGSMMAVFPVFREAGAQTIPSANVATALPKQVLTGTLINVSVLLNNVTYVGVSGNTIYIAMPANSNSTARYTAYNWSGVPMYSNTTALEFKVNSSTGVQIDAAITDGQIGLETSTGWVWGQQLQETYSAGATGYVGINVFYANLTTPPPKTVTVTLNAISPTGTTQLVNVVVYVMNSTVPLSISNNPVNLSTINTFTISWNAVSGADYYNVKVYYQNYLPGSPYVFLGNFTTTSTTLTRADFESHGIHIQNGTYTIYVYPYNATWAGGILFPGGKLAFEVDAIPPSVVVNSADLFVCYITSWVDNIAVVNITANGTITNLETIQVTVTNNAGTVLTQGPTGDYNLTIDFLTPTGWEYFYNYTSIGQKQMTFAILIQFNKSISAAPWYNVSVKFTDEAGNVGYFNYTIYNLSAVPTLSLLGHEDALKAGESVLYLNATQTLPNGETCAAINLTDSKGVKWFPVLIRGSITASATTAISYRYLNTDEVSITNTTSGQTFNDTIYLPNGEYQIIAQYMTVYTSVNGQSFLPVARIKGVNGKSYNYATRAYLGVVGLKSINITTMVFDTVVGSNNYAGYARNVEYNVNSAYGSTSRQYTVDIEDTITPWISPTASIYAQIPVSYPTSSGSSVSLGSIEVPLTQGNIPKGQDVKFIFHVNDTHLWYFNVSFQAAGESVGASIEFTDGLANEPTITITNGVTYFYIKSVILERNLTATFAGYPETDCWNVTVVFHINETIPSTATTLAYSWSAVDYGINKISQGPFIMDITNNTISASGETITPKPHGALQVTWTVSNTTRYAGFVVVVYNYTNGKGGIVPSSQGTNIWSPTTSIELTYQQITQALGLSSYNGTTNVTIYVISNDGHYGIVTNSSIVDNELPEMVNVTMVNETGYVSSPVVGADVLELGAQTTIYMNVTDEYTGVAKIVVDASSINSTGTFTYPVSSPAGGVIVPWQVTITVDKNVTGKEPITIYYYDAAGNVNSTTLYVYVDNAPPKVTYASFATKVSAGSTVGVTLNVTDEPAGLTLVNVSIGSSYNLTTYSTALAYKNTTYYLQAPTLVGNYTVYVTVEDLLGHKATYAVGTIHVYPAAPSAVSVVVSSINGKPTGYTPSNYNVVYVGDKFKLVATLKDQYGNVIPSQNVKLQWKIVVENSSGSAVPVDVPAYGDYAVFKALTMGKIEFEVYLLQYINPINGSVVNVTTPVSGTIVVYVIPGVNEVVITPAKTTLTVGTSTTVTVQTYYVDHSGKYFSSPVPAPFAKVNLTASAGTLPSSITTNNTGGYTFTYTAPKYIGVPYTTVVLTATTDAGASVKLTVVAGTPEKVVVTPSTTTSVATVPVKFTVSLYDQYGNPAYGKYNVTISVVNGSSLISSVPSVVVYNNGSVSFTLYTTPEAYGTIVLNVTYNSSVYQIVKITVLPLPDQAKITAPSEVAAYTGYNVTVYVYNSTYGVATPGALVKLYEQSSVYGLKYVGEAVTNATGYATIVYYPSLFKQNTNVTLIAEVYVNGTMVVQSTAKVLVKAYWPKVLIEKVVGPVPLAGQTIQPGRPFYVDVTLKSETYLPTNITVYVSLYKSGTGIEAGEWLITTAYVELGPNAVKTVRIFMILPYNAPTGNWTMVITLHDWNRFIKYGPQGSVLPWAGSRTYIVFYVSPPTTGTGAIQATEVYWRRFD